jgi:hypothetical protein
MGRYEETTKDASLDPISGLLMIAASGGLSLLAGCHDPAYETTIVDTATGRSVVGSGATKEQSRNEAQKKLNG